MDDAADADGSVNVAGWTMGRQLWLQTAGFSMWLGVALLRWLESEAAACITDRSWEGGGGRLVEHGIAVEHEGIRFEVMCSYGDLFVTRVSGSNRKFSALCDAIRATFVRDDSGDG